VTGTATAPGPTRARGTRAERERAAIAASLAPVIDAITDAAQARAQAIQAAAAADADAELARARREASRILDAARAAGTAAAATTAASQLTVARRQARECVLVARRQAYEMLRDGALAALVRRASTPDGRRLAERLQTLVRDRVGASASVHRAGPGNLGAIAESGNRRAELEPEELVDRALESLGAGIEALWA